jgi:hypothetical protein
MLPLGRLESRKRRWGAASCPACGGPEEDATHFVFTCGALHAVRDHMYLQLDSITSGAFGQLTCLMSRWILCCWACWETSTGAITLRWLTLACAPLVVAAWAARELAVVARGPATVLELEVDLESEHVPGPGRVRGYLCPLAVLLGL